jgi:asparagine synthase (glutamine-hydrolysing)
MFAFVLFDRVAQTLFVARDRLGIKPLYYWVSPERTLALASEIKQFSALPGWSPTVNGQRAYDFLAWSILDHTDETLFQGVYQLPPGASLQLDLGSPLAVDPGGRLDSTQWYLLAGRPFEGSFADAASVFREKFEDAVRSHLRADVPVGSCLSGGLDSSSIVCMANMILRHESAAETQHVFSSCSRIKRFDEREYVEEVVRQTGVAAHYLYPDLGDLFQQLDQLTWHQDEPFGSTSIFAQWSVFAHARASGVKVMLDGQGADEQLAGYPIFFGANFTKLLRQLHWLEFAREMQASSRLHGYGATWAARYLVNALLPQSLRDIIRALAGRETAAPRWLDVARLGAIPRDPFRMSSEGPLSIHSLSLQQLTGSNLQMLLHWEDRDSMAHSVEARVPFLDHKLVEFVLGLPDDFKISRGVTKRVLREGLRDVLPEAIRNRMSKLGFATPEEHWVKQEQPERFRQAVADAVETCRGILRADALQFADDVIAGRRPFDFSVWRMISFARWIDRFGLRMS